MFARVRVPAGPPVETLLIPAIAVGSDQGQKFVLTVTKDDTVEQRPIQVDRQHGADRAVSSGLKPEDRVIVSGLMMARPGFKVQVTSTASPGTSLDPRAKR
jgi:multidrug efflux pump subunit AcrA (membrane-fusion protein)